MNFRTIAESDYYKSAFIKYVTKSRARTKYGAVENIIENGEGLTDSDIIAKIKAKILPVGRCDKGKRSGDRLMMMRNLVSGPVNTYCDIGCGDCHITISVRDSLKCRVTYAIDTTPPDENFVRENALIFAEDASEIPDQSVDLVTIFMTLHHMSLGVIVATLNNCKRILKYGGRLIIREHDDELTPPFDAFMDLIHLYNSDVSYYELRSWTAWNKIITDQGFSLVKKITYMEPNPQRIFHASYTIAK